MRRIAILTVVFALIAVACSSGGSGLVATVNGSDITEDELGALYVVETLPVDETLRQSIFALIAREVLLQGLDADYGVQLDTAEVETVFDQLMAELATTDLTPADALGIPNASEEMVRFNAELGVIRDQVIAARAGDADLITELFGDPIALSTVCVRHVLVPTAEEADAVLVRLAGGDDFAEVATEVSLDTGTPGGDLGCSPASRYVPEFAQASVEAELGELFGPVESQFGFHVLIVDDRVEQSIEDVIADPDAFLTEQDRGALWSNWLNDKLQTAEVMVEERYGVWSPIGIIAPEEG